MALGTAAAFWAVSLVFVMTPGADWAYAIAAGVRHRTVLPAVGGLVAGHVLATSEVAAGVAALVAGSPVMLTGLTFTGAAYLAFLGIGMLDGPDAAPVADADAASDSRLRQAAAGMGISALNPKVFLLFLALMPRFVDTQGPWPVATQILTLGLLHVTTCAVIYTAVGAGARKVLRSRPGAARTVTRIAGTAMVVIGVVLLVEQLLVRPG